MGSSMFCLSLGIFEIVDSSKKKREAALLSLVKRNILCLVFFELMGRKIALCRSILICMSVYTEFMIPNQVVVLRIVPSVFLVLLRLLEASSCSCGFATVATLVIFIIFILNSKLIYSNFGLNIVVP